MKNARTLIDEAVSFPSRRRVVEAGRSDRLLDEFFDEHNGDMSAALLDLSRFMIDYAKINTDSWQGIVRHAKAVEKIARDLDREGW